MTLCPVTGKSLFEGNNSPVEKCGKCAECGLWYHISAMDGINSWVEWPIQYLGYYCDGCSE